MAYRNPNIIPYVPEVDKEYYYSFNILTNDKEHSHYCSINQSIYSSHYAYYFYTRSEFFYYHSYLSIFENLYLTFYTYDYDDTDPRGAYHEYFILSPSVTVKIEKEYSYM